MSDDLQSDLTDIDGVGDVTAEKILDVLADHDAGGTDPYLQKAREAAAEGNDRAAVVYLKRSGGA